MTVWALDRSRDWPADSKRTREKGGGSKAEENGRRRRDTVEGGGTRSKAEENGRRENGHGEIKSSERTHTDTHRRARATVRLEMLVGYPPVLPTLEVYMLLKPPLRNSRWYKTQRGSVSHTYTCTRTRHHRTTHPFFAEEKKLDPVALGSAIRR